MRRFFLLIAFFAGPLAFAARPDVFPELAGLRPAHPRLIAGSVAWDQLSARRLTDPRLEVLLSAIERDARDLLARPPAEYRMTGRRLLSISRLVERRVLVLATAYRLTGETAFLRRAEDELLAAAAFPDWNPSHFLDAAEMGAAFALGYDWLYAGLASGVRTRLRAALVEKCLRPALDAGSPHNGWQHATNNWNQVCFGGLVLGALALGDEEPETAGRILALARSRVARGLAAYAPDGVFPEGPGYWSFGTSYSVLMVAALESALGTDWRVSETPGFLASAGAFLQLTAPSGIWFNFSDCPETGSFEPVLFWFARRLRDPGLIRAQLDALPGLAVRPDLAGLPGESSRLLPLAALWWPGPAVEPAAPTLPLRWHGDGPNPVAVFRSSWTSADAFYLGLKGGSAGLSHGHMDAGSFVFECDGVRWARDLGRQAYHSLESKGIDLWNREQDSARWRVFRLNHLSHNTLTIDGRAHRVAGVARITGFSAADENPCAILDLTPVFAGQAGRVRRGFRVWSDRAVLVQDELSGLKPGADVRWAMATGAEVTIVGDGARAVLAEGDRHLEVRLLAPAAAHLAVIPAEPPDDGFNEANPGRRLLVVHAAASPDGRLTFAVWLDGGGAAGESIPRLESLDRWLPAETRLRVPGNRPRRHRD